MTIDKNQMRQAKKWAELIGNNPDQFAREDASAAAEVIQSLPDEIVDGDKLRDIIRSWSISEVNQANSREMFREIKTLLPAPAPQVEIALGAWAIHPEHGKVLIVSTKPDDAGYVYVAYECPSISNGARDTWVKAADLSPVPSATPTDWAPGVDRG